MKISRGRLSGVFGMRRHTAEELYAYARDLEAQANSPRSRDDPRWLRRWAQRIGLLADQKAASREHKKSNARHREVKRALHLSKDRY